MALSEEFLDSTDIHPIDIVESLAISREWDFDRVGDDQIAMVVEGTWRTYSITLSWSDYDETLRAACTFDIDPPASSLPPLYEVLNLANDRCWLGAFALWPAEKLMVYRYGMALTGEAAASPDQIDHILHTAVLACEQFYPAFQLVTWGGDAPKKAIQVAIAEAYGRA